MIFSKFLRISLIITLGLSCQWDAFARTAVIMRHAEALHNVQHVFNGSVEKSEKYPLSKQGEAQVQQAAKALKLALKDSHILVIFVSPLLRTKQTAQFVASELGLDSKSLKIEPLITESGNGSLEETSTTLFKYGINPMDHRRAHE
jgi:broad specificity phosphatase PhoE